MKSYHPLSHKLAAYNSMIHRSFAIPLLEKDRQQELNLTIANNNNFPTKIINDLINKKQLNFNLNQIYPYVKSNTKNSFKTLPYCGALSEKVSTFLKQNLHINIAFKADNNLSKRLFNGKDKTNPLEKCGVYKLQCPECNGVYIGQSGRSFKVRTEEHLRCFKHKKDNSNFSKHLIESNHSVSRDFQPKVLHVCNKGRKLNLLECMEINRFNKHNAVTLLNDQLDLNKSPLLNLQ